MGLKHLKLEEAVVEVPGGEFAVRGLNLNDIAFLVQRHGATLQSIFTQFLQQPADGELTTDRVAAFALPLITAAPRIAAEVVACASVKPWEEVTEDDLKGAYSLPMPSQLEALEHIARLTFAAEGGPKKLLETVIRLAQGTSGLLASLSGQET